MEGEGPKRLQLSATGPGEITAGQIATTGDIEVMNGDLVIRHLDLGEFCSYKKRMTGKERNTKLALSEEDEPIEWTDEMFDRARFSIGGKVIREATGTLTRRGRPPVGDAPKQQVTLRLPRHVLDHFKAGGAGWQTRIGRALEEHVSGARGGRSAVAEERSSYKPGRKK